MIDRRYTGHLMGIRPTLKKSVFPVQQVAKIVDSWAAAKFFFIFFFCKKIMKTLSPKNGK